MVDWFGQDTEDGGYNSSMIINHVLLQSGKYKVVGKMYPRFGKEVLTKTEYLSIEFECADTDKWKNSRYKFHPKIETPWDGLSENINYPRFEIATEIEVELPFVLDGWQRSLDLSNIDKTKLFKEVLAAYRQIHAILSEHNVSKFIDLSKEKQSLYGQAYYYSEEQKKEFLNDMAELFGRNLPVEPLIENELELQLMGYGKLVRLMRKDHKQPLQFKSPNLDEQNNIELEIILHIRNTNSGLSII